EDPLAAARYPLGTELGVRRRHAEQHHQRDDQPHRGNIACFRGADPGAPGPRYPGSPMRSALLHGFAGDPAVWDEVVAAWASPERPLAVALPGHGPTPVLPTWDENLDAIARAIAGCEVVIGYSLGARVALGLVASGRCAHGVLIGVNPGIAEA